MFDFCTAIDIRNNAWQKVDKFFSDHPEYNKLLKRLDEIITESACSLIRSDNGLSIDFDSGDENDDFYLAGYVNLNGKAEPYEEDVVRLGKMIVILLKLKGFDCTCEYEHGWDNSRLKNVTINLGGTEDGTV